MDILFSGILAVFCIYCFFLVGAESPAPTPTELGAAFWPRIILGLLLILLVVNIVNSVKKQKKEKTPFFGAFDPKEFFKSKLFVGMILVAVMAFLMPYIGFMPVCFLFLVSYGILLGERKPARLLLMSVIITLVLYVLFQGALDIMLARGIGVFREFALMCETIMPF